MITIDALIKQAQDALAVAKDAGLSMNKDDASQAAQTLIAHAMEVVMIAKAISTPHKLPLVFLGWTLRYPEDCKAGYQLTDEYFRNYLPNPESLQPRFLGDDIWYSSENCSDQGLGLFGRYDDFARRGDRW